LDVLGLSALDVPAAACLVRDGRVIAAAQEARFSRHRGETSFPRESIAYCLRAGKIGPTSLAAVVVAGNPDARVPSVEDTSPRPRPSSFGHRVRRALGRRDTMRDLIACELDREVRVEGLPRELSEAGAAFLPSSFPEAAVLVLGGAGQPTFVARGRGSEVEILDTLAADEGDAGEIAVRLAHAAQRVAPSEALVIGGPGGGNRPTNGRIVGAGVFSRVWIQPAAVAGGAAAGAALLWAHRESPAPPAARPGPGFGPGYTAAQIRTFLRSQEARAEELPKGEAPARVAELLAGGREVGWFDGRIDFGEDTAGSRSILRAPGANGAPPPRTGEVLVVPADRAGEFVDVANGCPPIVDLTLRPEWYDRLGDPTDPGQPRAVVAIDPRDHRGLAALLSAVAERTGAAALAARPLRPPGEPVACSPHDAWRAFLSLDLEVLVLGDFLLEKSALALAPATDAGHEKLEVSR